MTFMHGLDHETETDTVADAARTLARAMSKINADAAKTRDSECLMEVLRLAHSTVQAQEARIKKLQHMAMTDELTGLINRRGFYTALEKVLAGSARYGARGALLYLDLDGFKVINDRHGHAAGDAVLQHVARCLMVNVRETDYVARLGGDEFAILLVQTGLEDAVRRAAHLEESLNQEQVQWRGGAIDVRASVGMHIFDETSSLHGLLSTADAAMYRIKAQRKTANRSASGGNVAHFPVSALANPR
ncbi:MAG: GGDEF domain-containing protein [Magnetospiraceae bacterium]